MDFKAVTAVLVVASMTLAASTGYLLVSPGRGSTSTVLTTSTLVVTSTSGASSPYSVGIAFNSSVGFYLVNASGFTLYHRTTDASSNGTSTCTGGCILNWPAFYASTLVLPPGLHSSAFKVVSRADGIKQLSYNGWPLYTYKGDLNPGNIDGQGVDGVWFAYSLGGAGGSTTTLTSTTTYALTSVTTSATSTMPTTTTTRTTTCYVYCP